MKKRTAIAANSVLVTIIVLGIVCVLYYIAERHPLRKDLTENKTQSISAKTIKVLKNLDTKIEAVAFFQSDSLPDRMVADLLKEYSRRSKYFDYRMVDPELRPSETKKYGVTEYGVVFIAGAQQKKVTIDEIFRSTANPYNPYEQSPPDFMGEQAFTNAIISLSTREQKTLCFLEGHGEREINGSAERDYSGARDMLVGDNYGIKTVNLATEKKLPNECSVVIDLGPEKFFTQYEFDALLSYLEQGGHALFLLDPLKEAGISPLFQKWGVQVGNDVIIDNKSYFADDPLTPIPEFGLHEITADLQAARLTVSLPYARSVSEAESKPAGAITTVLLKSSDDSWAETDLNTPKPKYDVDADIKGPVSLAVAVIKTVLPSVNKAGGAGIQTENMKETRLVVVGDADFGSNAFTVMTPDVLKALAGGAGNADLFVNTVNWLAGEEELISIRPKPIDVKPLNITGPQRNRLFIICVVIIPVGLIVAGATIWSWRRKQ